MMERVHRMRVRVRQNGAILRGEPGAVLADLQMLMDAIQVCATSLKAGGAEPTCLVDFTDPSAAVVSVGIFEGDDR